MADDLPEHVRLVRRAQRDLNSLPSADRARIVQDIIRLAQRQFPGEVKKILGLPGSPLQADSGRFRVLHVWQGPTLFILAVFTKAAQRQVFRGMRR